MSKHAAAATVAYTLCYAVTGCLAGQPAGSVSLSQFGAAGAGGDDTAVLQAAIDSTSSAGRVLYIPASPSPYTVRPLWLRDNTKIYLEPDAIVEASSGYVDNDDPVTSDKMIAIRNVSNVQIIGNGATFRMRKAEYTRGEYRHCLDIRGSNDVYVSNINCNDSGGDGLYIGEGVGPGSQAFSRNITVEDSNFDNNRRQGFSLISGIGVYIRRCRFTNTNGTAPQAGIDIEPNRPGNYLQDVHIEDSLSLANAGDGVKTSLWFMGGTENPVDITVLRHESVANGIHGYEAVCQNSVPGLILVDHSYSTNDGRYGAVGDQSVTCPAVVFNYLAVRNPNQSRSTRQNAAVAATRQSSAAGTVAGNVHFLYPDITDTTGSIAYYFSFQDGQNQGMDQVHFLDPVQLAGASKHPFGLLEQQEVSSAARGGVPLFSPPRPAPAPSANGIYEAENAALSNGAAVATQCSSCSGAATATEIGAVAFTNILVEEAGDYTLTITYVNGSGGALSGMMAVNNGRGASIDFPVTGGPNAPEDVRVGVRLKAGSNRIVFTGAPGDAMADIDRISVVPTR